VKVTSVGSSPAFTCPFGRSTEKYFEKSDGWIWNSKLPAACPTLAPTSTERVNSVLPKTKLNSVCCAFGWVNSPVSGLAPEQTPTESESTKADGP